MQLNTWLYICDYNICTFIPSKPNKMVFISSNTMNRPAATSKRFLHSSSYFAQVGNIITSENVIKPNNYVVRGRVLSPMPLCNSVTASTSILVCGLDNQKFEGKA